MPAPDPQNPPQHLFVDERFGSTHVRKQDVSYYLPATPELLEAVREYLDFERWAGLTAEEKNQVHYLFELELSRKVRE